MSIASFAPAQSVAIADLQQDTDILKREVGQLRLEVEQLRRDNDALANRLKAIQGSSAGNDVVRSQINSVRAEVSEQNDVLKKEIIAVVRKDIEAMAAQTNDAMAKLAKAIGGVPQAAMPTSFSDNYPKTGITYTVKSGDSISKIARLNNSKIRWIQDANRIGDPSRDLHVGDEIFIPQQ